MDQDRFIAPCAHGAKIRGDIFRSLFERQIDAKPFFSGYSEKTLSARHGEAEITRERRLTDLRLADHCGNRPGGKTVLPNPVGPDQRAGEQFGQRRECERVRWLGSRWNGGIPSYASCDPSHVRLRQWRPAAR